MRMRAAVLASLLASGLISGGLAAGPRQMPDGLARNLLLQLGLPDTDDAVQWLLAAAGHEPGAMDGPAQTVRAWPIDRLRSALASVSKLKKSAAYNATLARGAMLHADLSLLTRGDGVPKASGDPGYRSPLFIDGRRIGESGLDMQLEFARNVIDHMKPRAGDPRALQWYRAIAADLASRYWLLDLERHNQDARRLFPHEGGVLFDNACEAETMTSPRLQAAVAATLEIHASGSPRGLATQPQFTARFNLLRAEQLYRDALTAEPSMSEARLRLAHVLWRLDRVKDAARMLETATDSPDPVVRYYSAMIRGRVLQNSGQPEAARLSFEQARTLYPRAQSAELALAVLARDQGNEPSVIAAMGRVAAWTRTDDTDDPWWRYYQCNGRNALQELERLRFLFRTGDPQ